MNKKNLYILKHSEKSLRFTIVMPSNTSFQISAWGGVNLNINWGDGSIENTTSDNPTHLYTNAGTYKVEVKGTIVTGLNLYPGRQYLLSIDNLDTLGAMDCFYFAAYAPNLVLVNGKNWTGAGVGKFGAAFTNCNSLQSVNLPSVTGEDSIHNFYDYYGGIAELFKNCPNLSSINMAKFKGNNVQNASGMFSDLPSLKTLNLPEFEGRNIVNAWGMIGNNGLENLSLPKFRGDSINNAQGIIYSTKLTSINLPEFRGNNIQNAYVMFYNNLNLVNFSAPNFVGGNFTNVGYFFDGANINTTDYSKFLQQLASVDQPNGLVFSGGSSKYNDDGQTAKTILQTRDSMTITDGGHI